MLLPVWFWVFLTLFGLVIVLVVSVTCLYFCRRVDSIIKDASSVVDFKDLKQRLDGEIEQSKKSLDENRVELRKLESERRRQESLKQELANLSSQVAQEKIKSDEYKKQAEDPHDVISARSQDLDRLKSEEASREIERERSEEQLGFENEEEIRPLVKTRRVRKHNPTTILS